MKKELSFNDYLQEQMQNAEFKEEYDRLEPQYQVMQAILDARTEHKITQKELADITGIGQADISRIEHGNANPSLNTLYRLAKGLGLKLKISFVKDTYAQEAGKGLCVAEG